MKTKIFKILFPVLIVIFVAFYGFSEKLTSTAFAIGDLTIDWGVPSGNPIFVVNNMLPGDLEERSVSITNSASTTRPVGVRGIKTSETGGISSVLNIEIFDGPTLLYGPKTLDEFFSESIGLDGIPLSNLGPGDTTTFKFMVTFIESAGNEYQEKQVIFDIQIGIAVDVPENCEQIQFSGPPIFGTSGNDKIMGTRFNDLIFAFEGEDRVFSHGGDDCIIGGPGNDELRGELGDDWIFGTDGNDLLIGAVGDDHIFGEGGNDEIRGENNNDFADGGEGNDVIKGGNGTDHLLGGSGDDELKGEAGADNLSGDGGVDKLNGGAAVDTCDGEIEINCEI